MMNPDATVQRDLALELIENKIVYHQRKLTSLEKARNFIRELKIDELAITREEAAKTIAEIIIAGYFE